MLRTPAPLIGALGAKRDTIMAFQSDLHDALVLSTEVWYESRSIRIIVRYYPSDHAKERSVAAINFSKVDAVSVTVNMAELKTHEFAGTISYWRPNPKGISYIYLASGTIGIHSEEVHLDEVDPRDFAEYRETEAALEASIAELKLFSEKAKGKTQVPPNCSFCGKPYPSNKLFSRRVATICISCLTEASTALNREGGK